MYKHSYKPNGPWQGSFDTPQGALNGGRAMYGNVIKVYVGKLEPAYFSDLFIGGPALLSYMQEGAEDLGDDFVAAFDDLPFSFRRKLGVYIVEAIQEWESDLPDELQFKGEIVKQSKGYTESAMVRPADFT
jgi:hypothetical protein